MNNISHKSTPGLFNSSCQDVSGSWAECHCSK